jgi:D-psicose/D-tagatose/L-ribulose 3-epimerase
MRVALCNEVIAELPFAAQCDLAAKLGYDGLEVSPFTLGDEPHRLTQEARRELRRAASHAGVVVTGLHYLMRAPAGLSITSRDKAQRERTVGIIRDLCGLAADLGGKVLVHGSPDQRKLEPGFEAENRKHAIDCFAAAGEAAAKAGVTYCIEPLSRRQTDHINTVEEAANIVTAVGNSALRTMIDCSSAAPTEPLSIPDTIRR